MKPACEFVTRVMFQQALIDQVWIVLDLLLWAEAILVDLVDQDLFMFQR